MAVDRDRHHGAAAVRLRLSRPQGPYADAEGGGRMVRGLRRDCDPLRAGHVDPWWSVDGNGVLRRLCDGEGTLGRQPVRLPHHHDQLRGAASRPTEGAAAKAKTPETVSCQLTGKNRSGASTKNRLPLAALRIAFQTAAPAPVARPPVRSSIGARLRVRSSRTAAAADSPAP